ncbi:MAG: glycosyltransferase [Sulfurimonas sp.]|uniref:glycosyltransferase family 2 protein n=1 Tax=Sulfurimonas sp. TaxID=2022749 RepID=UPI0026171D7F|nr:glycosyltransferase [Sulfurimonas sp.]MDD5373387.1 glycosyltransferase [Sulfurimonas sp.]
MKQSVLIVIPVLNPESTFFTAVIPMLLKQSIKSSILLISSSGIMPDGDYESIVIDGKDFNHANTRNMALLYDSDFYLFMTQDATPCDEYLVEKLLEPFMDEEVVVSYARQVPYENAHITERFSRNKNYPNESMIKSKDDISRLGIKTFFSSDSCALYRADYFKKAGGFKRDLNVSEDMEFAARAIFDDKKVAYCAEARVYHSHIYNVFGLYARYVAIGRFFKENGWIQESIKGNTSTERTGSKQVMEELKYIASKEPSALAKSFFYNLVKFFAYSVGKKF